MLTEMCFENLGFLYEFANSIGPRWREEFIQITFHPQSKLAHWTTSYLRVAHFFELLADVLKSGQLTHYLKDGFICSLDSDLNYYITVDVEICLRPTGYSKLLL